MIDWLRFLLMIFTPPCVDARDARSRSLAPIALIAFLSQVAYNFVTNKFAGEAVSSAAECLSELFARR